MGIKSITFVVLFSIIYVIENTGMKYDLVLTTQEHGASCLDGSPHGIYIHQGSDDNKDKFIIYFEGGGFCGGDSLAATLESCYKRSSTILGTTKLYAKQKSFDGRGLLSTSKEQNPIFYNWNKIYVIYCDGSAHQGYRQNPISYKSTSLYFRGLKNSQQVFRYLSEKYDFYNKDKIVITGVSAGGLGTYEWTNYLHQNTKTSKVYSMPDSGFFITDYYSPIIDENIIKIRIQNLLKLIGISQQVPQPIVQCLKELDNDTVACFNPGNYAKYVKPPLLIINSAYDEWALNNILVVDCLKNRSPPYSLSGCNDTTRALIQEYHGKSIGYFNKMKNNRQNVGIWSPACVQHGFSIYFSYTSMDYRAPDINGYTLAQAIQNFLQNPDQAPWLLDQQIWPGNSGCSGQVKIQPQYI